MRKNMAPKKIQKRNKKVVNKRASINRKTSNNKKTNSNDFFLITIKLVFHPRLLIF